MHNRKINIKDKNMMNKYRRNYEDVIYTRQRDFWRLGFYG